jgi:hypothetical protein
MISLEAERVAFYRELGLAIREWARVEYAMYAAMAAFFPESHRPMLGRGHAGLQGFHSKWLFAHNAIDRALSGQPELDEWAKLAGRLRKQSDARNRLVHNVVNEFHGCKAGERIASCPWIYPKGTDLTKPYEGCMCIISVVKARLEFVALTSALQNFVARGCRRAEPYPKSAEQAENPPTFLQLMRQLLAELGHPVQSSREKRAAVSAANAAASLSTPNSTRHE